MRKVHTSENIEAKLMIAHLSAPKRIPLNDDGSTEPFEVEIRACGYAGEVQVSVGFSLPESEAVDVFIGKKLSISISPE